MRVRHADTKWVSKSLVLQAAENNTDITRFGVVASKRLSRLAVDRNRAKRRMRVAASQVLPGYAVSGMDYVLIGRDEILRKPLADIEKDLRWCLRRLGYARNNADKNETQTK